MSGEQEFESERSPDNPADDNATNAAGFSLAAKARRNRKAGGYAPAAPDSTLTSEAPAMENPVETVADAAFPAEPVAPQIEAPAAFAASAGADSTDAEAVGPSETHAESAQGMASDWPADTAQTAEPAGTESAFPGYFTLFPQFEDFNMDMTPNFTDGFQSAIADAQEKAKAAFEKSTAAFGEYGEFAKGNVEALVESGKILTTALQDLGTSLVAESKSAFDAAAADIKELSTARSPADFMKLQSDLARKQFDSVVAYSSKSSEAMLKLATEVFAPISGRVSVAVEKARTISL